MRRQVAHRAGFCCEYCGISEEQTALGCHIDHVISVKHGGSSDVSNLAYACTFCNWYKGSDIASLDDAGALVPLFHPRRQEWAAHFALVGVVIQARTAVAEATVRLLRLNAPERLLERALRTG